MEDKRGRNIEGQRLRNLLLIIIALLLVVLVVLVFLGKPEAGEDARMQADPRAVEGVISGRSPEEIQAALNQEVEEGMFNVSVNSRIEVAEDGLANVCIENIQANHHLMRVDIIVTDSRGTEVTLYSSGLLDPGFCIETAYFTVLPPVGYTDAVAEFTALDGESEQEVGRARAAVILVREGG